MEFSGYLEVRTVSLVHITYVENFGGRGEGERERERELLVKTSCRLVLRGEKKIMGSLLRSTWPQYWIGRLRVLLVMATTHEFSLTRELQFC